MAVGGQAADEGAADDGCDFYDKLRSNDLPDRLGQAYGAGGGGVSTYVPHLRRRHPTHHIHLQAGAIQAQFTPGSRITRLPRPPPASDREYTPALSADKHLPEAHWRNTSILSPAVTATGTTFWAA